MNNNGTLSNEIVVLDGFDLKIRKGKFLVLVGQGGSGKSVFLDKAVHPIPREISCQKNSQ